LDFNHSNPNPNAQIMPFEQTTISTDFKVTIAGFNSLINWVEFVN